MNKGMYFVDGYAKSRENLRSEDALVESLRTACRHAVEVIEDHGDCCTCEVCEDVKSALWGLRLITNELEFHFDAPVIEEVERC